MNRIRNFVFGILLFVLIIGTAQADTLVVTDVKPSGGEVRGTISVNATVNDTDGDVKNVTFYYNDGMDWEEIGISTSGSNDIFSWNWNTTGVENGDYSIKAVAFDNNDNECNNTSDDSFAILNLPPTVNVDYPNGGEDLSGEVTINVTADDADGSVVNVTFYYSSDNGINWYLLGTDISTSSLYTYAWNTTKADGDGTQYRIKAEALNDIGLKWYNSSDSTFNVSNTQNIPPSVYDIWPNGGETISNGTITVKANANDSDGSIKSVEFYFNNGTGNYSIGSDNEGLPYEVSWNTSNVTNGDNYKIIAIATDNESGEGFNVSNSVFTINNSNNSNNSDDGGDSNSVKLIIDDDDGVNTSDEMTPHDFEFSVTYQDSGNASANWVRLHIDEDSDSYYEMSTDDPKPSEGQVYKKIVTLTAGATSKIYHYYFTTQNENEINYSTESDKKSLVVRPATYYTGNRIWEDDGSMSNKTYKWTPQSFSGFYYDLDTDVGSETLTIKNIRKTLDDDHIIYETKPIPVEFENSLWGTYNIIGFMADRYFAGYTDNTNFTSDSDSLLDEEQLSKVLLDTDKEYNVKSGTPLELEDGYDFRIVEFSSVNDNVMVALYKNGEKVAQDIVKEGDDSTFVYEKDLGGAEDMPIIAIYIDSVFVGTETSSVMIEGIFQISDKYIDVSTGDEFGKMKIEGVSSSGITMRNDNSVSLGKGDDFNLMGNINIIVADSGTLRFAPYVDMSEAGTYELRGTVTEVDKFKWTPLNFEGLLYDIDTGVGDEKLEIASSTRSVDDGELTYTTKPISIKFEHNSDGWKRFQSIGFMGRTYFAGYEFDSLPDISRARSLIKEGKLSRILIDEDKKHTMYIGNALTLEEGYSLRIDEISRDGDAILITLLKDGKEIDTDTAEGGDTYRYEVDVDGTDIPIVVAHIDSVFSGTETNSVFIDGLFQISDSFTTVEIGDTYGIMEVRSFDSDSIELENDDSFSLSKGDTIDIMGDIKIKVADDGTAVRFYPFQEIIVKEPLYLKLDIPDSVYENEEFTISVTSDGDEVGDVSIILNDSEIGTTDSNGELFYTPIETGEFKVTASKSGYESDSDNIEILYQPKALEISAPLLVDRNETIVISITSEGKSVSGVAVMFGSNDLGTTPASGNINHAPDQVGTHTITASKTGYQDASKDIDVTDPSARLVYSNLAIEPKIVEPGENVNITIEVANFGTLRDTDIMTLKVNGEEEATRDLLLGPGESTTIEFTLNRSEPGTYLVEVDEQSDSFKVMGSQFSSTTIAVLVILAILSAAAVIYSFATGTLSSEIIVGKARALKESLMRLIER